MEVVGELSPKGRLGYSQGHGGRAEAYLALLVRVEEELVVVEVCGLDVGNVRGWALPMPSAFVVAVAR